MFQISIGVPKMAAIWDELKQKVRNGGATKKEQQLFRKMGKAMNHLAHDPGYPGLHSHEITELSDRVGFRVWQSYIENNTPAAGRIYWAYGPGKGQITIMGIEPHPNDKANSYSKIRNCCKITCTFA